MMKYVIFFWVFFFFQSCSTKIGTTIYFDDTSQITKNNFNSLKKTRTYFEIQGDSINHRKIIFREQKGKIDNRFEIVDLLKKNLDLKINVNEFVIIVYYPGKDACNSSGSSDENWIKNKFANLEQGVYALTNTKPIYLYQKNEGLEKYNNIITWKQDPNNIIEKTFFKHHYPCNSFVVIDENGNFFSYFGEFVPEQIHDAIKFLKF
jgi:hypothetical protein